MGTNNKDRYYFKHDYHSRHDDKIQDMLLDYTHGGYGLFWAITEKLHEENNEVVLNERFEKIIAKELGAPHEIVTKFIQDCINKYGLFTITEGKLFSERVQSNLSERERISSLRKRAGKTSAKAKQNQSNDQQKPTSAEQKSTKDQQIDTGKERKGNEIKEKKQNEIKEKKQNEINEVDSVFSSSSSDSSVMNEIPQTVELPEYLKSPPHD